MKRIFTLLSLLLCVAAVAVADSYLPQGLNEISEYKVVYCTDITSAGNPATDWVVVPNYVLNNQKYTNLNGDKNGNPNGIEDVIPTITTSVAMIKLKNTVNTFEQNLQTIHMHVKGITGVIGHGQSGSTGRGMAISCTEYAPGLVNLDNTTHHAEVIRLNSSGSFIAQVTGLDAATEYVVTFYGLKDEVRFYCAEFLVPDGPVEAIDPVFSLTKPSITLEETSQIQVGNKGGLDGIAISGLEYDDKVVNVSPDGVVTPVGIGSTTIKFTSAPVEEKYNASSAELPIQVTAPVVATPVISPADGSFFIETATVTATCATEGALLYYATDPDASSWTPMPEEGFEITATTTVTVKAEKPGCITSYATATISRLTLSQLADVEDSATWDWSKFGTAEIKFTETTSPYKKDDPLVLSDLILAGYSISPDFGNPQQLYVTGEYMVRDSKCFQGGLIKFHTTVPGTVTVTYSNTGNRTADADIRFVNINGENYGEGSKSTTYVTSPEAKVEAGDVVIKGQLKGDGSDQYLRISKIVFTKSLDENPDDPTTGLDAITAADDEPTVVYDLLGRRVNNPARGIYIINGKKVLVK